MGRLFLVNLDNHRGPPRPYYLCFTCQNQIGFVDHTHPQMRDTVYSSQCLSAVVNVVVDGAAHYKDFDIRVNFPDHAHVSIRAQGRWADVNCSQCNNLLGQKIIEVANDRDIRLVGLYFLNLTKLLLKSVGGDLMPAANIAEDYEGGDLMPEAHIAEDNEGGDLMPEANIAEDNEGGDLMPEANIAEDNEGGDLMPEANIAEDIDVLPGQNNQQ